MNIERTIIKPSKGWKLIDLMELWRYKDLLYFLTKNQIKAKYAQSILGIGWAVIQPLVTTLIFTVVFGGLAKIDSYGMPYAVFSYLAIWPWTYFSGTLIDSSNSLVNNSAMLTKVYFPRMVLPLSAILSKLLDFFIAMLIMIGLLIYFQISPGWGVLAMPILMLQLLFCSLGLGMILSALAVQYRDVKHALNFMVQLLMYAAPVVYSTSAIPGKYQFLYSMNPMVGVIEGFRAAFTGEVIPWHLVYPGSIIAILLFIMGSLYFKKMERVFADVA